MAKCRNCDLEIESRRFLGLIVWQEVGTPIPNDLRFSYTSPMAGSACLESPKPWDTCGPYPNTEAYGSHEPDPEGLTLEFESTGTFEIRGRGTCISVKNPGGFPEPDVLTGQTVKIDGRIWAVRGVESFRIGRPYPDGLDFALLVEEVDV